MQLKAIKSPLDLKSCSFEDLISISKQLRQYIIDIISSNEGHLGASLGVIELTVLLHHTFKTPEDKILSKLESAFIEKGKRAHSAIINNFFIFLNNLFKI